VRTASSAWPGVFGLSTRFVAVLVSISARISEALPRTIAGLISLMSLRAVTVRNVVGPQPTGSTITGILRRFAVQAVASMGSTQGALKVPMLITSADASAVISSIASAAGAITGEAQRDGSALAMVFITT
jgi:hypothetical protein